MSVWLKTNLRLLVNRADLVQLDKEKSDRSKIGPIVNRLPSGVKGEKKNSAVWGRERKKEREPVDIL